MLGNFKYENPTALYFGNKAMDYLHRELPKYGKNVVLIYGGGSIKKNGIYDRVMEILKENDKNVVEDAGVMPNPTLDKVLEGREIAGNHKADLLLAVGAIMLRPYPYPFIRKAIRGKNSLQVVKSRPRILCPSVVY